MLGIFFVVSDDKEKIGRKKTSGVRWNVSVFMSR